MIRHMRSHVLCFIVVTVLLFCQVTGCQTKTTDTASVFEKENYPIEQSMLESFIHGSTYDRGVGIIFDADSDSHYFCTPVGAYVFAYTGGDGVHFCTIPDRFGDMVFVVEPMPLDEIHVRPVAQNFTDFIRILLAVRFTGILLDIPFQTEAEFCAGIQRFTDQCEAEEHTEKLRGLAEFYGTEPMEEPYTYIRDLQESFDYSKIPFSSEYYELTGKKNPTQHSTFTYLKHPLFSINHILTKSLHDSIAG